MNQQSKKQIYVLMVCDASGSEESEKLYVLTTSRIRLKRAIARAIHNDLMSYGNDELPKTEQVKMFRKDFEKETRGVINSRLHYGKFDYEYDGEEIF